MSPHSQARPDTDIRIDRNANAIVMTRRLSAPRTDVFDAWTQPERVAVWWDPSGTHLTSCEIDLRPGGAFRFVHAGLPDAPPFSGIYREITPPNGSSSRRWAR